MSSWVLDGSLAMCLVLSDEPSEAAERFVGGLREGDRLWVPALWWYEISNALTVAERRNRISEAESLRAVDLYRSLPVETDFSLGPDALWRYRTLAREHGLSAYDAAYLELAVRRGLALATLDGSLIKAARKVGVVILEL